MKFLVNLDRDETGMIVAECPAVPIRAVVGVRQGKVRKMLILHTPLLEHLCYRACRAETGIEGLRD